MASLVSLSRAEFVARFGAVYEHSPWVAEGAFDRGLGAIAGTVEELHQALSATMRAASAQVQLALIEAHPDLAPDLFNAFADAKRMYVQRLRDGRADEADPIHLAVMDITGDPLPYGIEPNRQTLEAIVQCSVEQGILSRSVPVEELFPTSTHALTG